MATQPPVCDQQTGGLLYAPACRVLGLIGSVVLTPYLIAREAQIIGCFSFRRHSGHCRTCRRLDPVAIDPTGTCKSDILWQNDGGQAERGGWMVRASVRKPGTGPASSSEECAAVLPLLDSLIPCSRSMYSKSERL